MNGFQGAIVFAGAEKGHRSGHVDDDLALGRVVLGCVASSYVEEVIADGVDGAKITMCVLVDGNKIKIL